MEINAKKGLLRIKTLGRIGYEPEKGNETNTPAF